MGILSGGGVANSNSVNIEDKQKYKQIIDTKLTNSDLINTVQKVIANTISYTLVSNSSQIENIITLNNTINFTGAEDCQIMGAINITNITQSSRVNSQTVNISINKVISDMTTTVNNNVQTNLKKISENTSDNSNQSKISSSFEGLVDSYFKGITDVVDGVGNMLDSLGSCSGAGNSCTTTKITENEKELITKYKLDNDFKFSDAVDLDEELNSIIKIEDITNIISTITGSNTLGADGLCPTFIDINNIKQLITIKNFIDNKTTSIISNKIATNYINKIDRILNIMTQHKLKTSEISSNGDIADLGDAIGGVINAGGNAIATSGGAIIHATGDIATSGVKGIGTVIGGIGGFIKNIFSGPYIYIIIIIIIFYYVGIPMLKKKNKSQEGGYPTKQVNNLYSQYMYYFNYLY